MGTIKYDKGDDSAYGTDKRAGTKDTKLSLIHISNILHGQVFDENFLMTIATIGALILGEHSEGVAVDVYKRQPYIPAAQSADNFPIFSGQSNG